MNNLLIHAYKRDPIAHNLVLWADHVDLSKPYGKLLAMAILRRADRRLYQTMSSADDYDWFTVVVARNTTRICGNTYIWREDGSKTKRESRHPSFASPSYWRQWRERRRMTKAERRRERTWAEVRAYDRVAAARANGRHMDTDATDRTRFDINREW